MPFGEGEKYVHISDGVASSGGVCSARASQKSDKILFIMHEERTCSGRVGQWFSQNGYQIEVRKPRWGDSLPQTLDSYCGVVIFGGNMSVNDRLDFIKTEIDWLSVPLQEKKPILGICLGAQLLVKHLGGQVVRRSDGVVEAGYVPVYPVANSPVQTKGLCPKMVYEWHEEGFDLPFGMSRFLTGDVFENQAGIYEDIHIGFQFHPEVTERILRRWINLLPEMLKEKGSQSPEQQIRQHLATNENSRLWLGRFLTAWTQQMVSV